MKEALLYEQHEQQRVRCQVCLRRCLVRPGERGLCGTRENHDGRMMTLIADRVSSACIDPIEKKPLYHFYPGTRVYSLGTLGCSFTCPGCQNWQISRRAPLVDDPSLRRMSPAAAVQEALRARAAGICWTYNDPAIWLEHTLEGARLAKEQGLYTVYVTNGSATREHLDAIGPYLDAYRVDIKAFSRRGYRAISGFPEYEKILDGVQYAQDRWDMHVECVTNVTPTVNDSDEELRGIARWIVSALGADTPWHITRFYPYEGLAHLPATPLACLDRAYAIGREEGLRYQYVGNVPDDPRQDTNCPGCGLVLVQRSGFAVRKSKMTSEGQCAGCGRRIAGVWQQKRH